MQQEFLSNPATGASYPIREQVPILLARKTLDRTRKSDLHQNLDSEFSYVDHYQEDARVFDYFTDFEDGPTRHENRRLHEAIIHRVPSGAKGILDVGCGKAWVAAHFCPRGHFVCSLDISTTNTQRALQTYPFPDHVAVVGDVYQLPFQDDSFDALISAEVIEHVPEVQPYLAELIRVVKPGGRIIISTPYDEKIAMHLCVHCNRPTPSHAHLHSFNHNKMAHIMQAFPGVGYQTISFSNKGLLKLRTHILLKYLPFTWWQTIDRLANRIFREPTRLLLVMEK
jgi:ubiquinone/menaquinone biosynthesis C-methylase UbiE